MDHTDHYLLQDPSSLHVFSAGRFVDLQQIGAGRHGKVFSAYDTELGRVVAVKKAGADTIIDELGGLELLVQAGLAAPLQAHIQGLDRGLLADYTLLREARLLALVQVPGVVSVLELGQFEDGTIGLVMQRLHAIEFSFHAVSWRVALEGVIQLAEGLATLHAHEILHRDIKADNVLCDGNGRPCLIDLGLACEFDETELMDHFVGSLQWMAPELIRGPTRSCTVQTDIYSFCMVAFQLFYGYPPFPDIDAKLTGAPVEIVRNHPLPRPIHDIVVKGLHRDLDQRWSSMLDLLFALRDCTVLQDPLELLESLDLRARQAHLALLSDPDEDPDEDPDVDSPAPTPTRAWLAPAAAGFGLAAALGAGVWATIPEARADACDSVDRELGDFWDHAVQVELRTILGSRRAGERLEDIASRWLVVRGHECDAAKREDQPLHASPCSAGVRDNLNAVVTTLRSPVLRTGVDFRKVLVELPEPEHCVDHPEDGDYANSGLLGLRRLDFEMGALLTSDLLDRAEQRQIEYMDAALEVSSDYDIARATHWGAELHRLRGGLDDAEADFKLAYASAQALRAGQLAGEAMLGLTRVAGARGDLAQLDSWAFVAAAVFAGRPDKHAEVLGVQGLALVESGAAEHERGLKLLREALAMREARPRSGSRAKVGQSLEALGRGLLEAGRDQEALDVVSEALAIYEDELGETNRATHAVRRLVFVARIKNRQLTEANQVAQTLLSKHHNARSWSDIGEEAMWLSSIYANADQPAQAVWALECAQQIAVTHGLDDLLHAVDTKLLELNIKLRERASTDQWP